MTRRKWRGGPWPWALVAVSFGFAAVLSSLGGPSTWGARSFRFMLPLLILLTFMTARVLPGRWRIVGIAGTAVVFAIEAPAIFLFVHDVGSKTNDVTYNAVVLPILLLVTMAVSMVTIGLLDGLNEPGLKPQPQGDDEGQYGDDTAVK